MSSRDQADPEPPAPSVNWLFSGVVLGAASWLLILGIVFVSLGSWIVSGLCFAGMCLCGLAIWRAGRRQMRQPDPYEGRHRAIATNAEAA
jgi:hypothetical protein